MFHSFRVFSLFIQPNGGAVDMTGRVGHGNQSLKRWGRQLTVGTKPSGASASKQDCESGACGFPIFMGSASWAALRFKVACRCNYLPLRVEILAMYLAGFSG